MTPVTFERSGPHLKPVARCDAEGCTEYALYGFDVHLGQAIDRKDQRLAGRHFCAKHKPSILNEKGPE